MKGEGLSVSLCQSAAAYNNPPLSITSPLYFLVRDCNAYERVKVWLKDTQRARTRSESISLSRWSSLNSFPQTLFITSGSKDERCACKTCCSVLEFAVDPHKACDCFSLPMLAQIIRYGYFVPRNTSHPAIEAGLRPVIPKCFETPTMFLWQLTVYTVTTDYI